MGLFHCCECGKRIVLSGKIYNGKRYCPICYSKPSFEEQRNEEAKKKELSKSFSFYVSGDRVLKAYDNEWVVNDCYNKREITLHKLFTYEYEASDCYSIVGIDASNGAAYIASYGVLPDNDGESVNGQWISYEQLNSIIKQKNSDIIDMFSGMNEENREDYIGKTYLDVGKHNFAFLIAERVEGKVHIGAVRIADKIQTVYAVCDENVYDNRKKSEKNMLCFLKNVSLLNSVSEIYSVGTFTKLLNYEKYRLLKFNISPGAGNADLVISKNCSTEKNEWQNITISNSEEIFSLIKSRCLK